MAWIVASAVASVLSSCGGGHLDTLPTATHRELAQWADIGAAAPNLDASAWVTSWSFESLRDRAGYEPGAPSGAPRRVVAKGAKDGRPSAAMRSAGLDCFAAAVARIADQEGGDAVDPWVAEALRSWCGASVVPASIVIRRVSDDEPSSRPETLLAGAQRMLAGYGSPLDRYGLGSSGDVVAWAVGRAYVEIDAFPSVAVGDSVSLRTTVTAPVTHLRVRALDDVGLTPCERSGLGVHPVSEWTCPVRTDATSTDILVEYSLGLELDYRTPIVMHVWPGERTDDTWRSAPVELPPDSTVAEALIALANADRAASGLPALRLDASCADIGARAFPLLFDDALDETQRSLLVNGIRRGACYDDPPHFPHVRWAVSSVDTRAALLGLVSRTPTIRRVWLDPDVDTMWTSAFAHEGQTAFIVSAAGRAPAAEGLDALLFENLAAIRAEDGLATRQMQPSEIRAVAATARRISATGRGPIREASAMSVRLTRMGPGMVWRRVVQDVHDPPNYLFDERLRTTPRLRAAFGIASYRPPGAPAHQTILVEAWRE